jgi:DNA-binding helix-hairpin-helix protein with protein kinase domain
VDKTFFTGKGTAIQIGRELGKGGEGSVYEVPSHNNQVAKIYHQLPDTKKQAKIAFMAGSADDQLLNYAAWPQETLHKGKNGPLVGFLMPKVAGRAPIHMLYSPAHRRQDYPNAAWDFLLFTARNTAAAFSTLHGHGHVLGDVNQGNVMVGKDSKVVLIDCDSFQINSHSEIHLCEVGVSHFTPPELQGIPSFDGVKRSANHDNFGLALLVFHLLFGGRHPYSGVPLSSHVGEALENDIKAYRFAYAKDAIARSIAPPPKSIPLSIVPESAMTMFEAAFTERGASGGRPTAQQWVSVLDNLRSHLRKCSQSSAHLYPDHLGKCPWCELEHHGVVYFIDLGGSFTATASGFVLIKTWAAITAVQSPPPISIPDPARIPATPTQLPPGLEKGVGVLLYQIIIVGGAIGLMVVIPAIWFLIVIGAWIALANAGSSSQAAKTLERNRRQEALNQAKQEFSQLEGVAEKDCGPQGFRAKKSELERLRDEYQRLPEVEKIEIDNLRATAEARQKHEFLDRCFIDSATISGVGQAKKAALRSFGIETAADVTSSNVRRVKGFGDVLTRAVVDWKKSCERRFTFDPRRAVSENDKNAVRAKIAARKRVIEAALASGPGELLKFQKDSATKYQALKPTLENAARKVAQAKADLSLLN